MFYNNGIDLTRMTDTRTALVCARLHLRNGKRRLEKGFSTNAITALYDAVLYGMLYYVAKHQDCAPFVKGIESWDAPGLFHALVQAGVFEDPHAFNRLSLIIERALWHGSVLLDTDAVIMEVEIILAKLGVMASKKSAAIKASKRSH